MIPRILEPEVMDTAEEADDYNRMDHSEVNRLFVDHLLAAWTLHPIASKPPRVLDVGTGTALIPIELCCREPAWRITAVDLSREMLRLAERNVAAAGARTIELVHHDAKRLPYADGSFEIVMSNSIVHHIPEPLACLEEMARLVAQGGLVFVRDLLRPNDETTLESLVETYAGEANERQRELFRASLHAALTLEEVYEAVAACDFDSATIVQSSDRHWTIAALA